MKNAKENYVKNSHLEKAKNTHSNKHVILVFIFKTF